MTTRGLVIGRFQPFHDGHAQLVAEIVDEVEELVFGIGSAGDSHTVRNPFTAGERIMMATKSIEAMDIDTTVYTVPIEDLNRNAVWVSHVESMAPRFDIAFSNNPLVVRLFTEAGVEVRQTPMYNRDVLKGSELRERMVEGGEWESHVPDAVVDVLDEIDGIQRIQAVSRDR
ncbi:nicotinamide-nucleotide adenylyltransferase [Halovenus aranensis]|jgi:nicotinamide-nucleotide adenylyltransferase|uniref:Nicotinamide-nucleotide adenylyltransferase n=1 Tax=Halovenus aranensis TaxID=890420 RepID=A0A1G8TN99_9EURY|nr:nicotinamide-nucleotide adenylyltransferase [Halovenus aranensis]SDJ43021.1 nicotinamide-nucleotide adenylyltransferase [Halovenus aranensis]